MTTIAWDGKYLAADSQTSSGSTIINNHTRKLVNFGRHNDGYKLEGQPVIAFGYGGTAGSQEIIKNALSHNLRFDDEFPESFEFIAIVITRMKHCYSVQKDKGEKTITLCEESDKFAMGSGRDFALAALLCGKTAIEAVGIASQLDAFTGGDVLAIDSEE